MLPGGKTLLLVLSVRIPDLSGMLRRKPLGHEQRTHLDMS
jgi:hypothetical protein